MSACLSFLMWAALAANPIDGNRLAYLDGHDIYYPHTKFPKLITPQWVGEDGVDLQSAFGGDTHRQSDGAHHGAGTLGRLGDDQRTGMRSGRLGQDHLRAADVHFTGSGDRVGRGAGGHERRGRHDERRQSHRPTAPGARVSS